MAHEHPTPAVLADVLDQAAAHLARVGLCRQQPVDRRQQDSGTPVNDCRLSLPAAINFVTHGKPTPDDDTAPEQAETARIAHETVTTHLVQVGLPLHLDSSRYVPGRTADVTGALRKAAARLRIGELPAPT